MQAGAVQAAPVDKSETRGRHLNLNLDLAPQPRPRASSEIVAVIHLGDLPADPRSYPDCWSCRTLVRLCPSLDRSRLPESSMKQKVSLGAFSRWTVRLTMSLPSAGLTLVLYRPRI